MCRFLQRLLRHLAAFMLDPSERAEQLTAELGRAGAATARPVLTADAVADATVRALHDGRGEVWVPSVLRPLFAVLRHLPRAVWRRMPR